MKQIERSWRDAPFIHIDPDCSYYELELPLRLGPFISLGFHGFGYKRDSLGWRQSKSHEYGLIIREGAALHSRVTVDRGSWRNTVIGKDARINAGGFVGHNVQIGDGLLLGKGATISGSSEVGDQVVVWNHAFIAQRCTIKDEAIIGAFSNVKKGSIVGEREVWWGDPAGFKRYRRENE